MDKLYVCGIPFEVEECEENFGDGFCGEIEHRKQKIKINKDMGLEYKKQTLFHEMIHGILVCIGRNDLSDNEQFVQALANGLYTSSIDISPLKVIGQ